MDNIDFSAFSNENFDPVDWLNGIFTTEEDDGTETTQNGDTVGKKSSSPISTGFAGKKETIGTNLVFKLQMMVEETNNSLEEIAQRMTQSIPKVMGEAEILGREAAELCSYVIDSRTKLICAEQQGSEAVETLIQLDTVKRRLEEAYKALQEANNWTTLSIDVDEVFESGDMEQISEKLSSMQKSLEMLSLSSATDSQHQDKIVTLEKLKDRFEKIVEPVLMESFLNQTTKSIEFYSQLFKTIHRSGRLVSYYQSCLRDQLLKEWSEQIKLDSNETLLNWLSFLYERLETIWRTQTNFCIKVLYPDDFAMSLKILCDIFTDIVMSLDPTIEFCFNQFVLRQQSLNQENQLLWKQKLLIDLKQFTNHFMKSIEQNIVSFGKICSQSNSTVPPTKSTLTIIDESFINHHKLDSLDCFIRTIYRPFSTFNQLFLQFETERLSYEFETIRENCTTIVICSEYTMKVFSLARESFKSYLQFVESYPLLIVDQVLESFLLNFLQHIRTILNEVLSSSTSTTKTSSTKSSITIIDSPNWLRIQQTLFAFQIVGEFQFQLKNFQEQIVLSLEENRSDNSKSVSYFNRFDIFVLNLDSNDELRNRIESYFVDDNDGGDFVKKSKQTFILDKVFGESIELAKQSASTICDAMMDYVELYFRNQFSLILKPHRTRTVSEDEDEQKNLHSISFSPSEYITQIGQYLLTLPQHLEPFNPNENSSFQIALRYSIEVFRCDNSSTDSSTNFDTTELLLDSILDQTTRLFMEHILKLPAIIVSKQSSRSSGQPVQKLSNLDPQQRRNLTSQQRASGKQLSSKSKQLSSTVRKQIGVDLAYLAAVGEDLGLSVQKEFNLFVQVFNDRDIINGSQSPAAMNTAFQKLVQHNSNYSRMLNVLQDILSV